MLNNSIQPEKKAWFRDAVLKAELHTAKDVARDTWKSRKSKTYVHNDISQIFWSKNTKFQANVAT